MLESCTPKEINFRSEAYTSAKLSVAEVASQGQHLRPRITKTNTSAVSTRRKATEANINCTAPVDPASNSIGVTTVHEAITRISTAVEHPHPAIHLTNGTVNNSYSTITTACFANLEDHHLALYSDPTGQQSPQRSPGNPHGSRPRDPDDIRLGNLYKSLAD